MLHLAVTTPPTAEPAAARSWPPGVDDCINWLESLAFDVVLPGNLTNRSHARMAARYLRAAMELERELHPPHSVEFGEEGADMTGPVPVSRSAFISEMASLLLVPSHVMGRAR